MSNLSKDFIELLDVLQKSSDHQNTFNSNHDAAIRVLMHRYDDVAGNYTQLGKSGIIAIADKCFKVTHYGYEVDWTDEYPIELLTDPTFILNLEKEQRDKKAADDAARKLKTEKAELKKLAELKAKYE